MIPNYSKYYSIYSIYHNNTRKHIVLNLFKQLLNIINKSFLFDQDLVHYTTCIIKHNFRTNKNLTKVIDISYEISKAEDLLIILNSLNTNINYSKLINKNNELQLFTDEQLNKDVLITYSNTNNIINDIIKENLTCYFIDLLLDLISLTYGQNLLDNGLISTSFNLIKYESIKHDYTYFASRYFNEINIQLDYNILKVKEFKEFTPLPNYLINHFHNVVQNIKYFNFNSKCSKYNNFIKNKISYKYKTLI